MRTPKIIQVDPAKLVVNYTADSSDYFTSLYSSGKYSEISPVPVMESPNDLRHLGEYMIYNGHKRVKSARKTGASIEAYLIQSDSDLKFLDRYCSEYNEVLDGQDKSLREYLVRADPEIKILGKCPYGNEPSLNLRNKFRIHYDFASMLARRHEIYTKRIINRIYNVAREIENKRFNREDSGNISEELSLVEVNS